MENLNYIRPKFRRGIEDKNLSNTICLNCAIEKWSSLYKILQKIYHVDTYETDNFWRLQGYIFVKDFVNMDIEIPSCEISVMDGEYILMITQTIEKKLKNK